MLVSVCMCTYKRQHLKETLRSVEDLLLPDGVELEILVVDNDKNKSGESLVLDFKKNSKYAVRYFSELVKNISAARNKYLDNAKGDWILSLDDDETADRKWLSYLLKAANKYDADAVFGGVNPVYPENTPNWIIKGKFFVRKQPKTGQIVSSGGAGCALTKRSCLEVNKLRFSLEYGVSGGEDSHLFNRLSKADGKLIYCREARVNEVVDPNRLNEKYLLRRSMRIGQTFSKYRFSQEKKSRVKLSYILNTCIKLLVFSCLTIITIPLGKSYYMKYLVKSSEKYGKINYFFKGNTVQQYM